MILIDELSSDLVSASGDLPSTLRRAKVLARSLGVPEFREWVDSELEGYSERSKAPSYRQFKPVNLGTYSGFFGLTFQNVPLPTYVLPEPVKGFAETLVVTDGVAVLEELKSQPHQVKWPPEFVIAAREHLKLESGDVLVDAHQPLPAHCISGILDQVKNRLLDFVLDLQENEISGDALAMQETPPELVRNLFVVNIFGDKNIVASGERVSQLVNDVREGDIESLIGQLKDLGLGEDDLEELKTAMADVPPSSSSGLGSATQGWLGRMVEKAALGIFPDGVSVAPAKILEALHAFIGLS